MNLPSDPEKIQEPPQEPFRPLIEAIDLMAMRIRISPTTTTDEGECDTGSLGIGPLTELVGAVSRQSVVVVEWLRLPCIDLVLTTALAFARKWTQVLMIDLRDWDLDLVQRLALVGTGDPALAAVRPEMSEGAANDLITKLEPLRSLPIDVCANRHITVDDLRDLVKTWASRRNGRRLLILAGVDRMFSDREQRGWFVLKFLALTMKFEVIAAMATDTEEPSERYRDVGPHVDTWLRLEGVAGSKPKRFSPVLERCHLRPPTILPPMIYSPDHGAWSRA